MNQDQIEDGWLDETELTVPPPSRLDIPQGVVFASVKGGVYACTVAELERVIERFYTPTGAKLRRIVIARSNAEDDFTPDTHAETTAFYADATPFELAVVAAWYSSSLRNQY